MEQRDFNKLANVHAAMDALRMYNNFVLFSASEEILQNPAIEVYFNSPLDAPVKRKIEKMVCLAAIRAIYQNPDIPQVSKERAAKATARGLRAALQAADLEGKTSTNELTVQEYNRRKRSNIIVKKAARAKMAKSILKNLSITGIATALAGPIGAGVAIGSRILGRFLPEKMTKSIETRMEKVKEEAYNVLKNTVTRVKNAYETFKSTSVGQKVEAAVNAVKPYATKAKEVVIKTAKKAWNFVKSLFPI